MRLKANDSAACRVARSPYVGGKFKPLHFVVLLPAFLLTLRMRLKANDSAACHVARGPHIGGKLKFEPNFV